MDKKLTTVFDGYSTYMDTIENLTNRENEEKFITLVFKLSH